MDGPHVITISDKSAAQQPSGTAASWAQFLAELRAYFVSNVAASVITVGNMFLFAGGLIFLVYFWSIGFMPEIDAKAFVTLLAASALTGGCLFILLSVYWVAPGYIWVQCTRGSEPLKSPLWFFLPMTGVVLGFLLSAVWIPKWMWVVPLLVFLIAPLPLLFSHGKILEKLNRKLKSHEKPININEYVYRPYRINASPKKWPKRLKQLSKQRFRQTLKTVGCVYLGLILSSFFFLLLFSFTYFNLVQRDSGINNNLTSIVIATALGSLYILSSNAVLIKLLHTSQSYYKAIAQYLIVGVISFFIILPMFRALPLIPEMVMNIYTQN